jgi:hypothetical protein
MFAGMIWRLCTGNVPAYFTSSELVTQFGGALAVSLLLAPRDTIKRQNENDSLDDSFRSGLWPNIRNNRSEIYDKILRVLAKIP